MWYKSISQKGFSAFVILVAIAVVGALVLVGVLAYQRVVMHTASGTAATTTTGQKSTSTSTSSSDASSNTSPTPQYATKTYTNTSLGFSLVYPATTVDASTTTGVMIVEDLPNNTIYVAPKTMNVCNPSCHDMAVTLDMIKNGVTGTVGGAPFTYQVGVFTYTSIANANDNTVSTFMTQHDCGQDSKTFDSTHNYYDIRLTCDRSAPASPPEYELFYSTAKNRLVYSLLNQGPIFTDSNSNGEFATLSIL